jgi:glycosyltransferase involved in cell wall biosynthesis
VVEAVNSALGQTYQNIEVIVVDDGSTDKSLSLVEQINDSRLRVFTQINQGACVARNRGIAEARGEFIKFLDSDDILYPEAITVQLEQQAELGENEAVFGDFDYIDEHGKVFYRNVFDETMYLSMEQDYWFLTNWEMLITCPLHKRKDLIKNNGFDNRLRGGQEAFLHLSLSFMGVRYVYRPLRVFGYRSHQTEVRISCQRMRSIQSIPDRTYRLESLLQLVRKKYGNAPSVYTTMVSQEYFKAAWTYFRYARSTEGRYCLRRSFEVPHLNYPKLKKSSLIARFFVMLGAVIGYVNAAKLIDWIIKIRHSGKSEINNSKLSKVLGQDVV